MEFLQLLICLLLAYPLGACPINADVTFHPALDPSYIGVYHCIAGNDRGKVYAVANVGVYKNGDDL